MKLITIFWYFLWLSVGVVLVTGFPPYLSFFSGFTLPEGIELIPFIGVVLGGILRVIFRLVALPLYVVIQFLEILPIVIFNSQVILGRIIARGNSSRKVEVSPDDSLPEKLTKKAYNAIPYAVVRDCLQWSVGAYVVDFSINAVGLPPVKNGENLFWVLATQQLELINWNNVSRILMTLFLLEAIVLLLIQITRMRNLIREKA